VAKQRNLRLVCSGGLWYIKKKVSLEGKEYVMKKWRCTTCGYIHKGETPPDQCPVCKMHKSMKPGPLFVEVK